MAVKQVLQKKKKRFLKGFIWSKSKARLKLSDSPILGCNALPGFELHTQKVPTISPQGRQKIINSPMKQRPYFIKCMERLKKQVLFTLENRGLVRGGL